MIRPKDTLQIYWDHAIKYKWRWIFIYSSMSVVQLLEDFASPMIISWTLTNIASGRTDRIDQVGIWLIIGSIVTIEIFANFAWNLIIRIFWRSEELVMKDLTMTVFNHLETMSKRFFSNRFAGSIVNQANKFVGSYERLKDVITWNVFKLLVALLATSVIISIQAPIITVAILILTSVYTPLVWYFRKKQIPFNKRWAKAETNRTGQLSDAVSNILVVKSFSNESLERKRMLQNANRVYQCSIDTMKINMNQELVTGILQRSVNTIVVAISLTLALSGKISIGLVYLSLTYTVGILRRLWELNNTFRALTRIFGDSHEMTEILHLQPDVTDEKNPINPKIIRGKVEFKKVGFQHPNSNKPLFNNFNLRIQPNEKLGLVGHSGGGKTTVTELLLRFMDVDSGTIEIDGNDISKLRQSHLRSKISYVPQEPLLFHRSIAENIAYGRPCASQKEIEIIARMAYADEFIKTLPDKYQTLVGERGVKLSGGQRQRIAIARAMIKNAPILILDEATSALDSESEKLIQKALWTLMEGKTAIIIAHRLSTIQKMDRIIVLDDGKIIEEGSHKELISLNGQYSSLWKHQSGGFMED